MKNNDIDNRILLRDIDDDNYEMVFELSIYGVLFGIFIEKVFFEDKPRRRFAVNHDHAFHEICLFAQGEGVLHVEKEAIPVKKHSVTFTPRFVAHHLSAQNQSDARPYFILFMFDEEEWEKVIGHPFKLKPSVIHNAESLFCYFERIQSEHKRKAFNSRECIRCLFTLLMTEILRVLFPESEKLPQKQCEEEQMKPEESELKLIYSIGAYFESNYAQDIRMEDLAEKFNISTRHFDRVMKKHFGMSFKKKLTLTRIQVAMHLLTNTDEAVSAIAEKVGYNSLNTFQRAFYQIADVSPSAYRKQSKNGHTI